MKKLLVLLSILASHTHVLPITIVNKQSSDIPVEIKISDVTDEYKEIESSLYYYKVSIENASPHLGVKLESDNNHINYTIAFQELSKNNSLEKWENNLKKSQKPSEWYEKGCLTALNIGSAAIILSVFFNKNFIKHQVEIGTAAVLGALCAAFIGDLVDRTRYKYNKAQDINTHLYVNKAKFKKHCFKDQHPSVNINQQINGYGFIIIPVDHELSAVEVDIKQNGIYYQVFLSEQ